MLVRAGEAVLDAQEHAEAPFDRIVQAVNPDRTSGHNPIFQVMVDAEPGVADRLRLPGVEVTPVPAPERGISLFDLSLTIGPGGDSSANTAPSCSTRRPYGPTPAASRR
nr:hypothetical protein GCM10020093_034310 [Planobispora longispora]